MSSNHPHTKGLSSHFVNLKIWRVSILTTTVLVVAVAAGYVATGATPNVIRSVSRTIKGFFDPQVHAKSPQPTLAQLVPVQDPVPTVVTDKTGYLGGEAVGITGTAFGPNEAVTLSVTHADGSAVSGAFGATATAEGTFEANWSLPNNSSGHGFVVTAVGNTSGASSSATFSRIAIVQTDKYDYQPGETATFTGAGFYANEVVTLQVVHSNGNNFGSGHEPFEATADADGRLTANWFVHPDDSESSIFRLTAIGKTSGLTATTTFTDVIISFIDDAGPDDEPGQKDLNAMSSDLGATAIGITWNWDDTGFGPLGGNTGDACTLVDTDADGLANFAFCVTVDGNPAVKVANRFYSCNDTRSDRCSGPTLIPAFTTTSTASVVPNSDPFSAHPNHSAGNDCDVDANCLTHDTVANVTLQLSDVGGAANARLLNVCSFPSEEPNSDPSDCVIHPDRGFLTIKKTTETNDNAITAFSFNTSAPSAGGVSNFSANIAGSQTNVVVANQVLFAPGTYNLSEVVPAGWDLATASCTIQSGSPTSTGTFAGNTITGLSIQTGLETICTFTNQKDSNIVVVKQTDPDGDPQSFSFTASYDADGFSLSDGQQNDSGDLDPGTYSVSETVPAGWDLESATCSDGSQPNSISLQAGETVTCTFTNEKDANIVVIKQTDPDGDPQSFTFTASYDGDGFSLSDGQQNDSGDLDPGTYSVSETVPSGWDLESATCSDGSAPANISLQAGETVTCTFTNEKDANIVVVKQTDPDGDPQSFTFTASYDGDGFSLSDGQQNDSGDLDPGTYSVSETVPSGWDLESATCSDGSDPANISLQAGETVTCTFTNEKDANIIVIKQTDPDGDPQSFTFTASYDGDGFSLSDGQQNDSGDLDPGTYSVSETVPGGWDLESATCSDGSQPNNISLQAGETVTCTFTNEKDANIIVIKQTDPDGDPQSFTFTASYDGDGFSLSDGQQNDSGDLDPGTYSVSETVPSGWDLESATCSDGSDPATISLQAGETVTCTFTNEKDANIIVIKQTDPDGDPQSFTFTASYDGDGFSLSDGQQNDSGDLDPGTYSVSETVPSGWDLESATCSDGSQPNNISLQAGETVTCTFTNEKDANIVVVKQTDPDGDPQSFTFTASYDGDGFSLSDGQQNDSGDLDPGTYSVSETVPSGWDLESATCSDGSDPATISLQAGETVTCTFTNEKDANIVVIKQTDPVGDPQSFSFTASYDNDGFSLKGGEQNESGDLDPGTYSVSETVPAGWDLESATCSDGSDPANISLDAGETVTCTFTNEKDANIVVIKQTDPDGDTQSFDFTASYDNDGFSLIDGGQNNSGDLDPGTYSVSETVPSGWDLTSSPCVSSKGHSETIGNISLQAGETVTCTFYNQKDANIVVIKQTDPDGDPQSFTFTASYDADGFSLKDGEQNDSLDINPGTYSVSETVPSGWDLTSSPCVSSKGNNETAGSISLQAGETVTCTFNNRKRGLVEVLKITNGAPNPALDIRFTLYRDGPDADPDLTGTDVQLETLTTLGDADGLLKFAEKLVPGTTYTICENPVPAGWTSLWTIGFSVGGNIITPYNPNANDAIPSDVGIRCVDFTVNPGQTKQFEVHNDFPGGDPRTIGYWKNWNRCTGGGQAANAAKNGGAAAGFFVIEDLLPQLIGDFNVVNCLQAVNVLSKQDQAGKSKSSDAAYELAAQFLAARFNLAAGAETCTAVQTAVVSAQNLLDQINFTGSGDYLTSKQKNLATQRAQALSLATTLDRYNNGILCP